MRHRSIHVLLTGAGIAGIAGLYAPFTGSVSPMQAIVDADFWRLAFPFFLSVAVAAASMRWIISGSFSKLGAAIAYVASGVTAASTLTFIAEAFIQEGGGPTTLEWIAIAVSVVIPVLGTYLMIRDSRARRFLGFRPVVALQLAYTSNAAFCLVSFFDWPGWQVGAYLALVTVFAYLLQISLVYCQRAPEQSC